MDIRQLSPDNNQYPEALRSIATPPNPLFVRGKLPAGPALAIVGTRRPSSYGRHVTGQMASELAARGFTIVSGLATGIDSVAHEAALEAGGTTIAVLACGLDQIYPAQHADLARRIVAGGGALISEQPPGTPPLKHHFIARNRLISGMASVVLITEAGDDSGARHTAKFAVDQGRELWAVPGHLTSPLSVLANQLIRFKHALPAFDAADIAAEHKTELSEPDLPLIRSDDPREDLLLELVVAGHSSTQQLIAATGFSAAEVADIISLMEITGSLRNIGAGQWMARPSAAAALRARTNQNPLPELDIIAE